MDKKKLERLERAFRNIKKSDELGAQPEAEPARIESAYEQRQTDLKRFGEMLQPMSGTIGNSVSDEKNFRIELENIPPELMEDLIAAIRKVRDDTRRGETSRR
jgi:hypothetical protein